MAKKRKSTAAEGNGQQAEGNGQHITRDAATAATATLPGAAVEEAVKDVVKDSANRQDERIPEDEAKREEPEQHGWTVKEVLVFLRKDFEKHFWRYAATVALIAVVVPMGLVFITVPLVLVVSGIMPLLIFATFIASPIWMPLSLYILLSGTDKVKRMKNLINNTTCAVLFHVLGVGHFIATQIFKIVKPNGKPSPQLRALEFFVKLTRQRGSVYTIEMFRKTCEGYAILFWYKKAIHRDTWMVKAENPSREVVCHYMRTSLEPEGHPPLIFYLHGGGFVAGTAGSYRGMIAPIGNRLNCNVFAVEYRKMPEHPLPAAVDDALAAYRYLTVDKKISPERIVFAGDSAGGSLCLLTLLEIRKRQDLQQPAGGMLMSPYVDLTTTSDSWERNRGKDFILEPRIIDAAKSMFSQSPNFSKVDAEKFSPATFPHTSFEGLPPLFVSYSTAEPLVDEVITFVEKAKKAGVTIQTVSKDHCPHVFQMFYHYCPEGKFAMDLGVTFLEACLRRDVIESRKFV
eukprot:TRINITY_DN6000_c0_g1_i1.p1 TRINITY_DN6000_c0_g1~~TRINITY_DN6000_c0_g1_i1.p1  ORF type:complete len:515 (+),score=117.30 TRINITY_DN6000_c0_g1_i1:1449-2993(+)